MALLHFSSSLGFERFFYATTDFTCQVTDSHSGVSVGCNVRKTIKFPLE